MSSECELHWQSRVHRAGMWAAFITVPPQQEGGVGAVREGKLAPANFQKASDRFAHMWMIKAAGSTVLCHVLFAKDVLG